MTYKIVHANNAEDLAVKVNGSIKAGFVCQGGVAVTISNATTMQNTSTVLAQAMIYENKDATKVKHCEDDRSWVY